MLPSGRPLENLFFYCGGHLGPKDKRGKGCSETSGHCHRHLGQLGIRMVIGCLPMCA